MSTLSEMISRAKQHTVTFKNQSGKTLFDLSLFVTVLFCLIAPQLAVLVLILYLLDLVQLDYDGEPLFAADQGSGADDFVEKSPS